MGVDKTENISLSCDICRRKFTKSQYLTAHRKYVHKIAILPNKLRKRLRIRGKVPSAPVKLLKKKIKPNAVFKSSSATMSPPKLKTNDASVSVSEASEKIISPSRRTVFQCPKCIKIFNVYFSAYKHIQKTHCVDANDKPVEPNSSQLIKPIRIETCELCQKPKTDKHECQPTMDLEDKDRCMCLGCQKKFNNLDLFEEHVKQLHASIIESFFFNSNNEYTAWKTELENSTKTTFEPRNSESKTKHINKICYCSHQQSLETNKSLLCPSFLQITEFKNSYFVNYYKEHFGHSCSEFFSNKYKKYCISTYLNDFDIKNFNTDKNIYELFKIIMNSVIEKSINVNATVLNSLLSKVLEMAVVLNSPGHDSEQISVKKNMTDDQITEVLSEVKTYPSRRKHDVIKNIDDNTENSTGNSSVSSNENSSHVNRALLQSPPSFNDTYKDFIDQTISKQKFDTPKRNSVKKKIVVKTKIGQYKPSLSPKETEPVPKISPKRKEPSPTTSVPNKKPKPVVLNKMSGKAAISPKINDTVTKTPAKTSLHSKTSKPSVYSKKYKNIPIPIKYEVKEQENDCNILILKI